MQRRVAPTPSLQGHWSATGGCPFTEALFPFSLQRFGQRGGSCPTAGPTEKPPPSKLPRRRPELRIPSIASIPVAALIHAERRSPDGRRLKRHGTIWEAEVWSQRQGGGFSRMTSGQVALKRQDVPSTEPQFSLLLCEHFVDLRSPAGTGPVPAHKYVDGSTFCESLNVARRLLLVISASALARRRRVGEVGVRIRPADVRREYPRRDAPREPQNVRFPA